MPAKTQENPLEIEILESVTAGKLAGLGVVRLTRDDLITLAASSRSVEVKIYGALVVDMGAEGDRRA